MLHNLLVQFREVSQYKGHDKEGSNEYHQQDGHIDSSAAGLRDRGGPGSLMLSAGSGHGDSPKPSHNCPPRKVQITSSDLIKVSPSVVSHHNINRSKTQA